MVYADHTKGNIVGFGRKLDRNCWFVEGGVDVINRNGVVRVSRVARHIAHDAELAVWRSKRLLVDEGWNLGRQVDAIDKNVRLDDLLVWAWLGFGLRQVPSLN